MLRSLGTARAKRIRRKLETHAANDQWLYRQHDPLETDELCQALRLLREVPAMCAKAERRLLRLIEINRDEDARHRENWYEIRAANVELAECEGDAPAAAMATPVAAS